jgi:hypothetical protein
MSIGVNAYLWRAASNRQLRALLQAAPMGRGHLPTGIRSRRTVRTVKITSPSLTRICAADACALPPAGKCCKRHVDRCAGAGGDRAELEDIILTRARDLRREAIAS